MRLQDEKDKFSVLCVDAKIATRTILSIQILNFTQLAIYRRKHRR